MSARPPKVNRLSAQHSFADEDSVLKPSCSRFLRLTLLLWTRGGERVMRLEAVSQAIRFIKPVNSEIGYYMDRIIPHPTTEPRNMTFPLMVQYSQRARDCSRTLSESSFASPRGLQHRRQYDADSAPTLSLSFPVKFCGNIARLFDHRTRGGAAKPGKIQIKGQWNSKSRGNRFAPCQPRIGAL